MIWYQYLSLACLIVCFVACLWHFIRLIRLGKPKDLSKKSGNIAKAEIYSYTGAMMPNKKESAYLHIPSFTLGIFFHIGTLIGILLFILSFFFIPEVVPCWLTTILSIILLVGAISGLSLLIKRIIVKKMRELSNADDFLSNFLTTLFQAISLIYLVIGSNFATPYYLVVSLLLLYIPVGKLRHVIYFFAARYHLGFFYGWRNSWPPQKAN